jgi:hypothetical protein
LDVFFERMGDKASQITDGFLDKKCLDSAQKHCGENVYLHRCLQHTVTNVKAAARAKDKKGVTRLRRHELCDTIVGWIQCSAPFPRDDEFQAYWESILERMYANKEKTDFDEAKMADYLANHILDIDGDRIRAAWQTGYGAVPLGFTTYAPNTIEVTHRVVKQKLKKGLHGLLGKGFRFKSVTDLIEKVAQIITVQVRQGHYDKLVPSREDPWPCLFEWPKKVQGGRSEVENPADAYQPEGRQPQRLDVARLRKFLWQQTESEAMYLDSDCSVVLPDGRVTVHVYVFPKYSLHLARTRPDDLRSMLQLGCAQNVEEVKAAYVNSKRGTYDIRRHRYLRQTYVTVWVCDDGSVVDGHKHFVEAAGHTEHQMLVKGLHFPKMFPLADIAFGPANSRPHKFKGKRRSRISDALRDMLDAPVQKGKVVIALQDPDAVAVAERLEAEAARAPAGEAFDQELPEEVQGPAPLLCMARTWNQGLGKRCINNKRLDSDYCGTHAEEGKRKHGRIDEAPPAFMLQSKAHPRAASGGVEKPVPKAASQQAAAGQQPAVPSKRSTTGTPPVKPLAAPKAPRSWKHPQVFGEKDIDKTWLKRTSSAKSAATPSVASLITPSTPGAWQLFFKGWRRMAKSTLVDDSLLSRMRESLRLVNENAKNLELTKRLSLKSDASTVRKRRARAALVKERVAALNLVPQYVNGDGNCQFTAVARSLGFPDDSHRQLRQEVVAFLETHASDYEAFQTDGWQQYLENLRSGEWGDNLTLLAMSRMFGCSFRVVSDNSDGTILEIGADASTDESSTITLAHYGEIHYESTVPKPT